MTAAALAFMLTATVAVTTASAYTPPSQTITTAAADVAAATAGDPTLSHLSSDLSTPTLQAEGVEVLAAIGALQTTYAGGSDPTSSILSSPTYLADEPAEAASITGTMASSGDTSATAALVGGDALDASAGLGLVPDLAVAAPLLPELAVATVALGAIAIATGHGTQVVDLLGGGSSDAPALTGLEGGDITKARWVAVTSTMISDSCAGNTWSGFCNFPAPTTTSQTYAMEVYASPVPGGSACAVAGTAAPCWVSSVNMFMNGALTPSKASEMGPGTAWQTGSCAGEGEYLPGWAPSGLPNTSEYFGGLNGTTNCTTSGGTSVQHGEVSIGRTGQATKIGFPYAGSTPGGVTPVTATPITSPSALANAIAALPGDLGAHPETAALINGSLGATNGAGGATIPVPGTFTIPAIQPFELATQYAADLATAGFTNVAITTASDTASDPERGPGEAIGVTPRVGTSTGTASRPVSITANPADAPYPAGDPAGTSTASGTGGTPSIDLSPLDVPLGNKFPFGVPAYIATFLGGGSTAATCPDWEISLPFGQHVGADMCSFAPVIAIYKPVIIVAAFIALAWQFMSVALGMGSTGESD